MMIIEDLYLRVKRWDFGNAGKVDCNNIPKPVSMGVR